MESFDALFDLGQLCNNKSPFHEDQRHGCQIEKEDGGEYKFSGRTDVVGIVFLDIVKITDLPERNSMYFPPLDLPIPNFDQCWYYVPTTPFYSDH